MPELLKMQLENISIEDISVKKTYDIFLQYRKKLRCSDKPVTLTEPAIIPSKICNQTGQAKSADQLDELNTCSIKIQADEDGVLKNWLLFIRSKIFCYPAEFEFYDSIACDIHTGRGYTYQMMRVSGTGNPAIPDSEAGQGTPKMWQAERNIAGNNGFYGNESGVAAGLIKEFYHPGFAGKRIITEILIGAVPAQNVVAQTLESGDKVITLGTDTQHNIQRLLRNPESARLIKRCYSIGESEPEFAAGKNREHMAVAVSSDNADKFISMAQDENVKAIIVAEVNDTKQISLKREGTDIVNISNENQSTNGTAGCAAVKVPVLPGITIEDTELSASSGIVQSIIVQPGNLEKYFGNLVSGINICSQNGMIQGFDATAGAGIMLFPLGGVYRMTPNQTMAAKIPVLHKKTETCSLVSFAYYPQISGNNPYAAAYLAVSSSVAKIVAAGGSLSHCRLLLEGCFEKPGINPEKWGKPFSALLGAMQAQIDLGVSVISAKDPMPVTFEDIDAPPVLISFAVSTAKAANVVSGEFKGAGNAVVLLTPQRRDDGLPQADSITAIYSEAQQLIGNKKVYSSYVVESGGIGEAVFKMSIGNRVGFAFDKNTDASILTHNYAGSIILELKDGAAAGMLLGRTTPEFCIKLGDETIDCLKMLDKYEKPLESAYATRAGTDTTSAPMYSYPDSGKKTGSPVFSKNKPRVLIPVFPGTVSEYDIAEAFISSGTQPELLVIKDLSGDDIRNSTAALADAVLRSNIVVLQGSAGYTEKMLKEPQVRDAVYQLLNQRDGLICGIAGGFSALLRLGLIMHGEICDVHEDAPALTKNLIGRYQSAVVQTRVVSNKSPWYSASNPGDIHTVAIAHGEGRLVADKTVIDELAKTGQIATQYIDLDGNPTMDIRYNPMGSMFAIEAMTSPDGRVLGKMGHNERVDDSNLINIPDREPANIYASAVKYFKL